MHNYNSKTKIVFFGASRFVLPVIEMLHGNFDLVLVITTERKDIDPVPAYCKKENIKFLQISKFDQSTIDSIKRENSELGSLAYFGLFLPKELLNIFPRGILNIHPSLLPLYRGPTPVQSAILDGKNETGVTIIRLDKEMDHGPVLGQEKTIIKPDDTTETLHEKLFAKGAQMLLKIIPNYIDGKLKPVEQDHKKVTFSKKDLSREDGYINIDNPPSKKELDLKIRAYHPWPGTWTNMQVEDKTLRVKFLPKQQFQVEGKNPISLKDLFNGYPEVTNILKKLF